MKIEALYILLRQAVGKIFNLRLKVIAVALLCACLASAQNAEALSARFQVGFGDDSGFDYPLPYIRTNLNLFLYDSTRFDIFIGGELAESEHQETCLFCSGTIDSSYEYKAATAGIYIKPFEKKRMNPYLILGVVQGSVKYSAIANDSLINIISLSRNRASYTTYRTGIGLNIAIIKKLGVEVEINYSGGVPDAYAVIDRSGTTSNVTMFDGSPIINIALGVRYFF